MIDATMDELPLIDSMGFVDLLLRFLFNCAVILVIIRAFYYPRSRRRDYFFTFMLISISIFLMIFLLSSVKLKIGFALGLFAIFGIIRYRTEQMPVREMTYLFVIIAVSVINSMATNLNVLELLTTNLLFILSLWLIESRKWLGHLSTKLVLYDRIDLITPDKRAELIEDLEKRIGIKVERLEVGHIDFLRDSAMLKIYYEDNESNQANSVDTVVQMPKDGGLL